MAENKSEIDVLNHLLEVEKEASLLIEKAVEESVQKVSAAKSNANSILQEKSSQIQKELESEYQAKNQQITEKHSSILSEYESQLKNRKQNTKKFNSLLKDLFAQAK